MLLCTVELTHEHVLTHHYRLVSLDTCPHNERLLEKNIMHVLYGKDWGRKYLFNKNDPINFNTINEISGNCCGGVIINYGVNFH